jgi:hypothetical protein
MNPSERRSVLVVSFDWPTLQIIDIFLIVAFDGDVVRLPHPVV